MLNPLLASYGHFSHQYTGSSLWYSVYHIQENARDSLGNCAGLSAYKVSRLSLLRMHVAALCGLPECRIATKHRDCYY